MSTRALQIVPSCDPRWENMEKMENTENMEKMTRLLKALFFDSKHYFLQPEDSKHFGFTAFLSMIKNITYTR